MPFLNLPAVCCFRCDAQQPRPVRLIGVSIGSLSDRDAPQQMSLFDVRPAESSMRKLDGVIDHLQQKIGSDALYRGNSHRWVDQRRRRDEQRSNGYEPPLEEI